MTIMPQSLALVLVDVLTGLFRIVSIAELAKNLKKAPDTLRVLRCTLDVHEANLSVLPLSELFG